MCRHLCKLNVRVRATLDQRWTPFSNDFILIIDGVRQRKHHHLVAHTGLNPLQSIAV